MLVGTAPLAARLKAVCAQNGAPGATVETEFGPQNPLHVMLTKFAEVAAAEFAAAVPRSRWILSSAGVPTGPPLPFPSAAPRPTALPAEWSLLAQALAAQMGWTGRAAAALPRSLYQALAQELAATPRLLTVPAALRPPLATAVPAVYQFVPSPIAAPTVARRLQESWNADPFLSAGDASRRETTARLFSRTLVDVWARVRPVAAKVGPTTGPPPPPVLSPAQVGP